jgi:thymidylate synthase (FAD)
MITEPKVTVLAYSELTDEVMGVLPLLDDQAADGVFSADYLAEFAGRACYQSFDRPNAKTARTDDYIDHILDVRHYSVLSHASVTFYLEGISRSLSLELIRSRFLAFSQLSQRYVDSSQMDWVCPPMALENVSAQTVMQQNFDKAVEQYEVLTEYLTLEAGSKGYSGTLAKKRAREAARAVLPNDTETKLVVSGNLRAWRDFIAQRWTVHADLEIQRLAGALLVELKTIAPATFADFNEKEPAS